MDMVSCGKCKHCIGGVAPDGSAMVCTYWGVGGRKECKDYEPKEEGTLMDDCISREAAKEFLKRAIFGADIKIDKWMDSIPAADVVAKKDFNDCRNELCLKCGRLPRSHLGACDGCRWQAEKWR